MEKLILKFQTLRQSSKTPWARSAEPLLVLIAIVKGKILSPLLGNSWWLQLAEPQQAHNKGSRTRRRFSSSPRVASRTGEQEHARACWWMALDSMPPCRLHGSCHACFSCAMQLHCTCMTCCANPPNRYRHLLNDLTGLIPHSKKDSKLDTKTDRGVINEVADMKVLVWQLCAADEQCYAVYCTMTDCAWACLHGWWYILCAPAWVGGTLHCAPTPHMAGCMHPAARHQCDCPRAHIGSFVSGTIRHAVYRHSCQPSCVCSPALRSRAPVWCSLRCASVWTCTCGWPSRLTGPQSSSMSQTVSGFAAELSLL